MTNTLTDIVKTALEKARAKGVEPGVKWSRLDGNTIGQAQWGEGARGFEIVLDPEKIRCQRQAELVILHELGHLLGGHLKEASPRPRGMWEEEATRYAWRCLYDAGHGDTYFGCMACITQTLIGCKNPLFEAADTEHDPFYTSGARFQLATKAKRKTAEFAAQTGSGGPAIDGRFRSLTRLCEEVQALLRDDLPAAAADLMAEVERQERKIASEQRQPIAASIGKTRSTRLLESANLPVSAGEDRGEIEWYPTRWHEWRCALRAKQKP